MTDFPNRAKQSYFETTLASPIDSSTTTIVLSDVPDYASGGETTYFSILNPKGAETISATGWSGSSLTGVTRGVVNYSGGASSAAAHGAGIKVVLGNPWQNYEDVNTALSSKADLAGGTFTGDVTIGGSLDFTGTDVTLRVPNLTEVERDAIVSPANGMIIYNTTAGTYDVYDGGAWDTLDTGATTPNGSDTVAGIWQGATVANQGAKDATGSTGAGLVIQPKNLVNTSAGAGDENKIAMLDSAGKFDSSFIPEINPSESMTAGENVTAGDALRAKIDGQVYKCIEDLPLTVQEVMSLASMANAQFKACQIDDNKIVVIYLEGASSLRGRVFTYTGGYWVPGTVGAIHTGAAATSADISKIDDNKFVVAYLDSGAKSRVCTVSGTTITIGAEATVDAAGTSQVKVVGTGTDKYVVGYAGASTNYYSYARACTVSGTTSTVGAQASVNTSQVQGGFGIDVGKLDEDKFVITYEGSGNDLYARAGTVSGTTITLGSAVELDDGIDVSHGMASGPVVEQLATDAFIVGYRDQDPTPDNMYIVVGTVSGTTITGGTPVQINSSGNNTQPKFSYIDENKAWILYAKNYPMSQGNNAFMNYGLVTNVGTVPTIHNIATSPVEYAGRNNYSNEILNLDGERAVILNSDSTDAQVNREVVADNNFIGFADDTVTSGNPVQINHVEDDNQTGLTPGAQYFLDDAGAITTDGFVKAGTALSATKILVN